ncbi:hypothetical protein BBF96_10615 [Anoxybacter fermentans]|uniref:HTH cro/C1-type domain-containing protein n=1 Tax=Anoxybacter fermentans TaxID=1323375 RepID=A0A3Q9HQY7_9FIRM|nr:helix-turn-helix transcriptional regulator [Anoxybacter fermentans]AZR73797.1 hypothetical protein BBF96_10615 [Anoxybacter fermentans]
MDYDNLKDKKKLMGERLAFLLKEHNIKNKELAKILNVSESYISAWKNGHRLIPTLYIHKISEYFGVPVSYLMGEDIENHWQKIGKKIAKARKLKNMQYIDLAKKTGIAPIRLSQIERGIIKAKAEELEKIAEELNLTVDELTIDFESCIEEIKKLCVKIGVSDESIEAIIQQIKFDIEMY